MKGRRLYIGCLSIIMLYICMAVIVYRNPLPYTRLRSGEEVSPIARTYHIEDAIPQRDLMFDLKDRKYFGRRIGFINADGSGFTMRTLQANIYGFRPYYLQGFKTWNKTGTAIVTRLYGITPVYGHPLVIDQNGHARVCWDNMYDSEGRLWLADDSSVIIQIKNDHDASQIVLLDMNSCEITRTLYTETQGRTVYGADLSKDGWLCVRLVADFGWGIAVINPAGEEVKVITDAYYPAWSADGQWLAYARAGHGIYIEHRSESEGRRIIQMKGYSIPTWSPDGKWLAYTSLGSIMKVNIETGEQVLIFEGGNSPSWNWGMAVDSSTD